MTSCLFGLEIRIGNAQVVEGASLEQTLVVFIHFAYTKLTKAQGPRIVLCTYSGVKVFQNNELVSVWGATNDS